MQLKKNLIKLIIISFVLLGLLLLLLTILLLPINTVYSYKLSMEEKPVPFLSQGMSLNFEVLPTKQYFFHVKEPYNLSIDFSFNQSEYKSIQFDNLILIQNKNSINLFDTLDFIIVKDKYSDNFERFDEIEEANFSHSRTVLFETKDDSMRFYFSDIGIKYQPNKTFDILIEAELEDSTGNKEIVKKIFHFIPKITKYPYLPIGTESSIIYVN